MRVTSCSIIISSRKNETSKAVNVAIILHRPPNCKACIQEVSTRKASAEPQTMNQTPYIEPQPLSESHLCEQFGVDLARAFRLDGLERPPLYCATQSALPSPVSFTASCSSHWARQRNDAGASPGRDESPMHNSASSAARYHTSSASLAFFCRFATCAGAQKNSRSVAASAISSRISIGQSHAGGGLRGGSLSPGGGLGETSGVGDGAGVSAASSASGDGVGDADGVGVEPLFGSSVGLGVGVGEGEGEGVGGLLCGSSEDESSSSRVADARRWIERQPAEAR